MILALAMTVGGCDYVFRIDYVARTDASHGGTIDSHFQDARVVNTGPRIVFVTSRTYVAGALDGLSGADDDCQALATATMLPGAYGAWLSSTTESPQSRMSHDGGPFVLSDRTTHVAETWAELTGGTLQHPIDRTEIGMLVIGTGCDVWTNTKPDGLVESMISGDDCDDWSTLDQGGPQIMGSVNDSDARWTRHFLCGTTCGASASAALYCIQQ